MHTIVPRTAWHFAIGHTDVFRLSSDEFDEGGRHACGHIFADGANFTGKAARMHDGGNLVAHSALDALTHVRINAAEIHSEGHIAGDDVHYTRCDIHDPDGADDGRICLRCSRTFHREDDFGRCAEGIMAQRHRGCAAVIRIPVNLAIKACGRGNACDNTDRKPLMLEHFPLLDMEFEHGFERLRVLCCSDMVGI